jgi:predicted DNA-binding WGR domain protein
MARRTFHYRGGNSDKFWAIELQGDAHAVHFGRSGTQGQTQTKRFASAAEAQKSHDRLIREKLAKGYVEETGGGAPPPPPGGPAAAPDAAAWREALLCCGVPPKRAAAFAQRPHEDIVQDFTTAVLDTPFGVATDWKDSPTTALQFLAEGMEQLGVHIDVEEVDDQLQVFVHSGAGGERFVRRIADPEEENESLHDVIFALDRVLPKTVELYLLEGCEGSDTYGHAVLSAERWQRVRELLGPAFGGLFRKQRPHGPAFRRAQQQASPSWADLVQRTLKDRKGWLAKRSNRDSFRKARQEVMDILERRKDSPLWERHWTVDRRFPEWREEFLASFASPLRFDYIQGALETIVLRLSTQGAVRVLGGDEGGWPLLRAGLRYDYYRHRIALAQFTRLDGGKTAAGAFEGRDWALLLSRALALAETEVAEWCGRQALRHPRAFGFNYPLPLQPFMARLYALWKKATLDARRFAQSKLGPYRDVIAAWHNEGRLAAALARAGDYHARQARHDQTFSEFTSFPADLFPAEILAVDRVRRDLGLPTPDVRHSILSTPLARPPAAIPATPDDVLDRLMTAVEEELPE